MQSSQPGFQNPIPTPEVIPDMPATGDSLNASTFKEVSFTLLDDFYAIDFTSEKVLPALFMIFFNPAFWNLVAQQEYKTHFLTKLFRGHRYAACYFLGLTIFSIGILRDYLYHEAILSQPTSVFMSHYEDVFTSFGIAFVAIGQVLVLSSMWKLGITGTYLGDYFGILMKERVTSFPFNVTEHPMYNGSTLIFYGTAFWYKSLAGVIMSELVWISYFIYSTLFEGPFTTMIYEKAAKEKSGSKDKDE